VWSGSLPPLFIIIDTWLFNLLSFSLSHSTHKHCHELQFEPSSQGHPFELPRYSYELCRKSFVLRRLYEFKWFFGSLFIFLSVTIALIFFVFLRVRLLHVLDKMIVRSIVVYSCTSVM